jgi:ABC-type lipoprotein export system ATPase subunit
MSAPVIECTDLVRIYRRDAVGSAAHVEVQALQGLDLRVEAGELVAIVGESGSGKSTLLSILSALDRPTAGTAVVAGHDLGRMRPRDAVRYHRSTVGLLFQQRSRNLIPTLTARENLELVMSIAGRRDRAARAVTLLGMFGIAELADTRSAAMSGGQQVRTAIAVALANEPEVLLADEPTGELDEASTEQAFEAIRTANRELGMTSLIVTHDPSVSEQVRRTLLIRDGRISTETHRAGRDGDPAGGERGFGEAHELAVLDRAGRLQLPSEFVHALQLRDLVRLDLLEDRIEVHPGAAPGADEGSGR